MGNWRSQSGRRDGRWRSRDKDDCGQAWADFRYVRRRDLAPSGPRSFYRSWRCCPVDLFLRHRSDPTNIFATVAMRDELVYIWIHTALRAPLSQQPEASPFHSSDVRAELAREFRASAHNAIKHQRT